MRGHAFCYRHDLENRKQHEIATLEYVRFLQDVLKAGLAEAPEAIFQIACLAWTHDEMRERVLTFLEESAREWKAKDQEAASPEEKASGRADTQEEDADDDKSPIQ